MLLFSETLCYCCVMLLIIDCSFICLIFLVLYQTNWSFLLYIFIHHRVLYLLVCDCCILDVGRSTGVRWCDSWVRYIEWGLVQGLNIDHAIAEGQFDPLDIGYSRWWGWTTGRWWQLTKLNTFHSSLLLLLFLLLQLLTINYNFHMWLCKYFDKINKSTINQSFRLPKTQNKNKIN